MLLIYLAHHELESIVIILIVVVLIIIITIFVYCVAALQANKRQKLMQSEAEAMTHDSADDEAATSSDDDGDGGDSPPSPSAEEEDEQPQQGAGYTLDLGSAPGGDGKFRDENFYLGYDRGDNRYAEEGFAVGGRGEDMVLDLAGDENVSLACCAHACCITDEDCTTHKQNVGSSTVFLLHDVQDRQCVLEHVQECSLPASLHLRHWLRSGPGQSGQARLHSSHAVVCGTLGLLLSCKRVVSISQAQVRTIDDS